MDMSARTVSIRYIIIKLLMYHNKQKLSYGTTLKCSLRTDSIMSSSQRGSKETVTTWCSDALHDLLGYADAGLASYLVAVARKAPSAEAVRAVLQEGGCNADDGQQRAFCEKLVQRVQKTSKPKSSPARTTNADWVKAASEYQLLDLNENSNIQEGTTHTGTTSETTERKKKKRNKSEEKIQRESENDQSEIKKRRKRHYRETHSDQDDEEGTPRIVQHRHDDDMDERRERRRQKRQQHLQQEEIGTSEKDTEPDLSRLTAEERAELERERDLKERDEMVQRMLERDQKKTKQKASESENDEAFEKRLKTEERLLMGESVIDEKTGTELSMERLREQSRRAYLKKREERELTLLKQSLQDEEELFKGQELTAAEKRRIELNKKILAAADERRGQEEDEDNKNDGFYRLPDEINEKESKAAQQQALLASRYLDPKHEKSEGELWEESQTQKAAGGRKKKKTTDADKYELIFEDQIDFVMQETTKGYDKRDKKHKDRAKEDQLLAKEYPESKPVTEHEKILEGRKKLPVFVYREEFLKAVKEFSVIILVGETGSGRSNCIVRVE